MSLIELKNVKKEFPGKNGTVTAVNEVNLSVEKGDIFGIVGYSGAGKSTMVRLFNGLELPTSGEVIIDNQNLTQLTGKELREFRKDIGMIFQHFNLLWSRTILDNVLLPLEMSGHKKAACRKKAEELLLLVGLQGKEEAYPSQLSGGQKQRVGIARALANDPKILLCDEGTSALDPQTTDEVLDLLLDINKKLGLTIVLITHEMHVIRKICNKVAVMEQGRIVETGEVIEVFRHPQEEVTKRFVQQEISPEETGSQEMIEAINKTEEGILIQLKFEGEKSRKPTISQAIREYEIDINVIQGQIQPTQSGSFGTLVVQLLGADTEINQAIEFFKKEGVGVEVIRNEK